MHSHLMRALLLLLAWSRLGDVLGQVTFPLSAAFVPPAWRLSDAPVSGDRSVTFTWLLPQNNPDELRERFQAVSDPASPQYQQFMPAADILAHLTPVSSVVQPVFDYLSQQGVDASKVIQQGDSLQVTATVAQINTMFDTTMNWYTASGVASRQLLRATGGLTIPQSLAASTRLILDLVTPPVPARVATPDSNDQSPTPPSVGVPDSGSAVMEPSGQGGEHSFHPMQASPTTTPSATYTSLSCSVYANRTGSILVATADFIQAQYNMTFRKGAVGYDGVRVAVVGNQNQQDNLFGDYTHECYSSADLVNIGAAYGMQQAPQQLINAPYARVNDILFAQQVQASLELSLDSQSVYLTSPTSSINM